MLTDNRIKRIRLVLGGFICCLLASGATAIPLEWELKLLAELIGRDSVWVPRVRDAIIETNAHFPFLAYGTDWLGFAHFVIAIAFVGPWRDPVKNIWVVGFGMIACALVVPFALAMGGIRGVPMGWRLVDCAFGVVGFIPLWFCRREIKKLIHPSEQQLFPGGTGGE